MGNLKRKPDNKILRWQALLTIFCLTYFLALFRLTPGWNTRDIFGIVRETSLSFCTTMVWKGHNGNLLRHCLDKFLFSLWARIDGTDRYRSSSNASEIGPPNSSKIWVIAASPGVRFQPNYQSHKKSRQTMEWSRIASIIDARSQKDF